MPRTTLLYGASSQVKLSDAVHAIELGLATSPFQFAARESWPGVECADGVGGYFGIFIATGSPEQLSSIKPEIPRNSNYFIQLRCVNQPNPDALALVQSAFEKALSYKLIPFH